LIGSWLPGQHSRLHQGAHALLQKKGIALGALDQQRREGYEAGVIAKEALQECLDAHGRQRVQTQQRVVGLVTPGMLVLWSIVHQQQQRRREQAVHKAVQQGLGLGVNPVQIFKDQEQRLHLTFAQQYALECGERALPPQLRIKPQKWAIGGQRIQESQQRRNSLLQGFVQGQEVSSDLGPDGARVIAILDVDIALQQVHNREVGGGLAVRYRGSF